MKALSVSFFKIKKRLAGASTALLFVLFFTGVNTADCKAQVVVPSARDTSVSSSIKALLANGAGYYYPASLNRFYLQNGYNLAWIKPETAKAHSWEAMLLLDCVIQFGLNHADYHPQELVYDKLHFLTEHFDKASATEKAVYDIMLTDAMLAFMNNLHYGKLNPNFAAGKVDEGVNGNMVADSGLTAALIDKDFMSAVINVQPKSAAYVSLQYHMHLLAGLYTGDCYDTPEGDLRKMAVNMERLRWISNDDLYYIGINIPSYTLTVHKPDTAYLFKVIVGKPATATPTLESAINYFTTAPEWKVPQKIFAKETLPKALKNIDYLENNHFAIYSNSGKYLEPTHGNILAALRNPTGYYARQSSGCDNSLGAIVFRFPNVYDVYLHDTPEQKLFAQTDRAFSHGCIRVENAGKLAGLLLQEDGIANKAPEVYRAMKNYQTKTFTLKKAVPIKVTYLTSEVVDGYVVMYNDIYNLDKRLEMALYGVEQPLTMQ
ncbi:MAG: L,D-transpeptidase family protein [Mucilaginibacter sp.]